MGRDDVRLNQKCDQVEQKIMQLQSKKKMMGVSAQGPGEASSQLQDPAQLLSNIKQ